MAISPGDDFSIDKGGGVEDSDFGSFGNGGLRDPGATHVDNTGMGDEPLDPWFYKPGTVGTKKNAVAAAAMAVVNFIGSVMKWMDDHSSTVKTDLRGHGKVKMPWGEEHIYMSPAGLPQFPADRPRDKVEKTLQHLKAHPEAFKEDPTRTHLPY